MAATGLCRSDWHGWQGHDADIQSFPHVPGHELAGTVVAVGKDVRRWRGGERVTLPFVCGCGHCGECRAGNPQVCAQQFQAGFTAWGSFAEYVAVDYADFNLVALPDDMQFDTAALLGCRVVTAYRAVQQQGRIAPGEWLVVFGCGGVGLSAVMFGHALGARVIAVDINAEALSLATELGAQHALLVANRAETVAHIVALTGGGASVSLDALGSAATSRDAIACLRRRGRHVQVGLMTEEGGAASIPMARIISEELEIIGSHGIAAASYPEVFQLIADNKVKPRQMLAREIGLEAAGEALMSMASFDTSGVTIIRPDMAMW